MWFDTDRLKTKVWVWNNHGSNYWVWGLGETLTKANDIYSLYHIKMPTNMMVTGVSSTAYPWLYLGCRNSGSSYSHDNGVGVYLRWNNFGGGNYGAYAYSYICASDGTYKTAGPFPAAGWLTPGGVYYFESIYDSGTGKNTTNIYNMAMGLLDTLTTASIDVADDFSVNQGGIYNRASPGNTNTGYYSSSQFEIYSVYVSSDAGGGVLPAASMTRMQFGSGL